MHVIGIKVRRYRETERGAKLRLQRTRRYGQDDDETADHQGCRDKGSQGNASAAGGELAPDNPVLALKVSMEADEEDEYSYTDKGGA